MQNARTKRIDRHTACVADPYLEGKKSPRRLTLGSPSPPCLSTRRLLFPDGVNVLAHYCSPAGLLRKKVVAAIGTINPSVSTGHGLRTHVPTNQQASKTPGRPPRTKSSRARVQCVSNPFQPQVSLKLKPWKPVRSDENAPSKYVLSPTCDRDLPLHLGQALRTPRFRIASEALRGKCNDGGGSGIDYLGRVMSGVSDVTDLVVGFLFWFLYLV